MGFRDLATGKWKKVAFMRILCEVSLEHEVGYWSFNPWSLVAELETC